MDSFEYWRQEIGRSNLLVHGWPMYGTGCIDRSRNWSLLSLTPAAFMPTMSMNLALGVQPDISLGGHTSGLT
jgi:hypothetical protein